MSSVNSFIEICKVQHSLSRDTCTNLFDFYVHSLTFAMSPGPNASVLELADSIHAAQMAEEPDCYLGESPISCSAEKMVIFKPVNFMLELHCLYFLRSLIHICYDLAHADLCL